VEKSEFYRRAREDRNGPLHGIRVIEAATAWAGPMVGCALGDLGCDVVHVDLPGTPGGTAWPPNLPGTSLGLAHQTVNRNKSGVTIDLRRSEGAALFLELVAGADIVVENFKPGTLDGWGVGYEQCRAVNEAVIFVSVSGWGQFGPWSERAGYDPVALAAGGWMSLNGDPDGPPLKGPTYVADDLAGIHAALGAVAALQHRNATGEGQHVDVALLDALLFQSNGYLTAGATGLPLQRWGSEVGVSVPTNTFRCDDGYVYIAMILDAHWRKLCELMGRSELAEDARFATNVERIAHREQVNGIVAGWCATRTRTEVLDALNSIGVAVALVNSYAEAASEPHVLERDMLQSVTLSDGSEAPITGPAAKFSRTPTRVRHAAPVVGADTDSVLEAAGVSAARRATLRAAGVI